MARGAASSRRLIAAVGGDVREARRQVRQYGRYNQESRQGARTLLRRKSLGGQGG